jgi:hypothetical protein
MNLNQEHIGELMLRRLRAGEALGPGAAAIQTHAASCTECRARARALDDEQRRFEQEISFDRFAAGVERAARGAQKRRRSWMPKLWMAAPLVAMAAAVALVVTIKPSDTTLTTRMKGGSGMLVRVAGAGGQRTARSEGTERLAPGERLRIGYTPYRHRYLLSFSIDDKGTVTPLYPERGSSLAVADGSMSGTRYLPDAIELTGAGLERIVVILSDSPLDVAEATRAARAAFEKGGGDLTRMPQLGLSGEEFSRTFAKP